jgi:hypothetical protein
MQRRSHCPLWPICAVCLPSIIIRPTIAGASAQVIRVLDHSRDRAGVYRRILFRLWNSCGDRCRSLDLWVFCGLPRERGRLSQAEALIETEVPFRCDSFFGGCS